MSGSYENRRRRRGIYAFLGVYLGFMLAVIVLEMVRNSQLGYGLF
jgi:hypothetical protein